MSGAVAITLPPPPELAERLRRTPLVVLLDVDGTLSPIASRPELATVPADTREALRALASRPGVMVAVVSGRGAADARRLVAVDRLTTIGNHGVERIEPDGRSVVDERVERHEAAIGDAARDLERELGTTDGVIIEDKRWTLSVHYRLAERAVVERVRQAVHAAARARGLAVTAGKEVLELRPPVRADKGTAAVALARELGAGGDAGAIVYIGDDSTDEDAFRELRAFRPDVVTIHVGGLTLSDGALTEAEFLLADPDAVRTLLAWLATHRA